jgi:hypothetical protein
MKSSNVKSQKRKKTIWDYLPRYFGKSFWIMALWCVSCAANTSITITLPAEEVRADSNIVLSPEIVDFGILALGDTSLAQTVTIRNSGPSPVSIDHLATSMGFSITSTSCPQPPATVDSQGTCTVEVVFAPSLPENWVGYLRVNRAATIQLIGSAHSGMEILASLMTP